MCPSSPGRFCLPPVTPRGSCVAVARGCLSSSCRTCWLLGSGGRCLASALAGCRRVAQQACFPDAPPPGFQFCVRPRDLTPEGSDALPGLFYGFLLLLLFLFCASSLAYFDTSLELPALTFCRALCALKASNLLIVLFYGFVYMTARRRSGRQREVHGGIAQG